MTFNYHDVALDAKRLRKSFDINTSGIPDIFSFVNQQNIDLFRYPFGRGAIMGFSAMYEGKKIIVSNSSEILSREIYTVAHELGHILYDFKDDSGMIRVDKDSVIDSNISEQRAYYFADCLLMPEDKINFIIKYMLKKDGTELSAINIIQMQLEFRASYNALIKRLGCLNIITPMKQKELFKERDFYSSKNLFAILGADEELLHPSEKIVIPPKYIDFVMSNYKNGYIPFSSLKNALALVNIDTSGMTEERVPEGKEESLDDVFEEYL